MLELVTLREQEEHRLRLEAPRDEREHLRRGPIQPLGIVDQADERLCFRRVGQQAQTRQADEKAIWPGP